MAYKNPLDERAKISRRKHYNKNKEQYYKNNAIKRQRMRDYVNNLKNVPCADCKKKYPPVVMDFDHKDRNKKLDKVSNIIRIQSWKKLKEEIPKCEVVCSNCHRIRTSKQLNYK